MIRILLADDHAIFLQGLTHLIESLDGIDIVGQAMDGAEAWEKIQLLRPDVAVLDITMPRMNGIEIVRRIHEQGDLHVRSLILTMHEDPLLGLEAIHAGAAGYLLKENTFDELAEAIHTVYDGGIFVTPAIRRGITELERFGGTQVLSDREREVLGAIARGQTNKEIARQLEISPKTVETYRMRIMDKLNVRSIADLSRYAVRLGLVR